jgi:fluoroacetyl-CoA thioesterase
MRMRVLKMLPIKVEVHDDLDLISRGRYERFIIDKAKFDAKMGEKLKKKNP